MIATLGKKISEKWLEPYTADKELSRESLKYCIEKVRANLPILANACPSENGFNGHYKKVPNEPWTTGFWPGMVWLAYISSGEKVFLDAGNMQTALFEKRLKDDCVLQHHDIGFLYSLSTVADYMSTGNEKARDISIGAAERLMKMYRPNPGIIQRGGDLSDLTDRFTGVFIVDCMMNVPLLFWAAEQTGDKRFYNAGYNHMKNSVKSIIKEDGRVVQHGIANPITGEIISDSTQSQGLGGDEAAWSRGQAWAICGLPITYSYTKDELFLDEAKKVIWYFLDRLPDDHIANWDLYYTDNNTQRDTSASAIAVCGMLELVKYLDDSDPDKEIIYSSAMRILDSLSRNYRTKYGQDTMGLLDAGVYQFRTKKGLDEPTIWGDYYYMEAIYRANGGIKRFW